jgi:hypothetical protein
MDIEVRCPRTRGLLNLSLNCQDDPRQLARLWKQEIRVDCPHCGEQHAVEFRLAWQAALLCELSPRRDVELSMQGKARAARVSRDTKAGRPSERITPR